MGIRDVVRSIGNYPSNYGGIGPGKSSSELINELKNFPEPKLSTKHTKSEIDLLQELTEAENKLGTSDEKYDRTENRTEVMVKIKKDDESFELRKENITMEQGVAKKNIKIFKYTKNADGKNVLDSVVNYHYHGEKLQTDACGCGQYPTCRIEFQKDESGSGSGKAEPPPDDSGRTASPERPAGPPPEAAPAAPAGTDINSNPTKAAEFLKKLSDGIKGNLPAEYKAGDRITVAIPDSVKNEIIAAGGVKIKFKFIGSNSETESELVPDMPNFYIDVPGDIKPNQKYGLAASIGDGKKQFVKEIKINPADTAAAPKDGTPVPPGTGEPSTGTPATGTPATGAPGTTPTPGGKIIKFDPKKSIEFLVKDKPIDDSKKWKVKPGKTVTVKIYLEEDAPEQLLIYAGLPKDGSLATPDNTGIINKGERSGTVSFDIPDDYKTGNATLVYEVNPYLLSNGARTEEPYRTTDGGNQIPNIQRAEGIKRIQSTTTINIDKAAFDVDTKTKKLMKRAYNPKTRMWKSVPTDFKMPMLPDGDSNMNDIGGWYTKSKFGDEDTESFNVGLYYHKNPVNCEDSSALFKFATETVLPQKAGFDRMSLKSGILNEASHVANCANGVTIENKAYEMECADANGSTYIVRIHTDIEKGPFGRAESNIIMHIVETSKPTKTKDGKKGIAKIDDVANARLDAWDRLDKANGKIEEVIPEKKEDEKKK